MVSLAPLPPDAAPGRKMAPSTPPIVAGAQAREKRTESIGSDGKVLRRHRAGPRSPKAGCRRRRKESTTFSARRGVTPARAERSRVASTCAAA